MKQVLDIFSDNRKKGAATYIVDDFEGAAFRFIPDNDTYFVFVKWKGKAEKPIDRTLQIAADALLGGRIISEDEYNSF